MSNWFFRIAVLYLMVGISLGIYMGASGNHMWHPLHAHINLLGFVLMMLFGFWYRAYPQAVSKALAKAHFGLYLAGTLVQMVTLQMLLAGQAAVGPILGVSGIVVGVSILCFAVLVWQHTTEPD